MGEINLKQDKTNNIAKFTAKDSVFTDLFKDSKYLLMLCQALHSEDKDATEADIKPVTLKNVIMANMYNDLGIMVKDRILILTEVQSS